MKILLGVQNPVDAEILGYTLTQKGFDVITVSHGFGLLERWPLVHPDLILIDSMLPPQGGSVLCRRVRALSSVPVMLLLRRADSAGLLHGYEAGADDCVENPFDPRQLLLRIGAVLRRAQARPCPNTAVAPPLVQVGDLLLDPARTAGWKAGVPLQLTRLEFRILYCLAERAGHLVERSALSSYVWHSVDDNERLLKSHISRLRRKLLHAGGDSLEVRGVPRSGYLLVRSAPVAVAPDSSAPALSLRPHAEHG